MSTDGDENDDGTRCVNVTHVWTVYAHPADYPGRYVVRRFACGAFGVLPDRHPWAVTETLTEARLSLPEGLTAFPRAEDDEPSIVESWL